MLKSAGMTFNSEIWAKRSLDGHAVRQGHLHYAGAPDQDAEAAAKLQDFLAKDYKKAAVNAQLETEYYQNLSDTTAQFSWAIGFLAVVMSVGGIFGVMNTMFAAVSQRTGDIGVLAAVGLRPLANPRLLPAGVVGHRAGGRTVGLPVGLAFRRLDRHQHCRRYGGGGKMIVLQLAVDANIIAGGILLTLLMGLLGGLLPAVRPCA